MVQWKKVCRWLDVENPQVVATKYEIHMKMKVRNPQVHRNKIRDTHENKKDEMRSAVDNEIKFFDKGFRVKKEGYETGERSH